MHEMRGENRSSLLSRATARRDALGLLRVRRKDTLLRRNGEREGHFGVAGENKVFAPARAVHLRRSAASFIAGTRNSLLLDECGERGSEDFISSEFNLRSAANRKAPTRDIEGAI